MYAIGYNVLGFNFLIGSGFNAHYTDAIWTNAHVANGLSQVLRDLAAYNPTPFAVKSGTVVGGSDTYVLDLFYTHPDYTGGTNSPDIAILVVSGVFTSPPAFLPREFTTALRVGQPIATMGFPGEIQSLNTTIPIASFKDGTISAMRPFNPATTSITAENNKFVQHNLDLSGGSSGSPIFDQAGWIIAINNSGTERLTIDATTGAPTRIPSGNIGFGIRSDEAWRLVDLFSSSKPVILNEPTRSSKKFVGSGRYFPFPVNWNGLTVFP